MTEEEIQKTYEEIKKRDKKYLAVTQLTIEFLNCLLSQPEVFTEKGTQISLCNRPAHGLRNIQILFVLKDTRYHGFIILFESKDLPDYLAYLNCIDSKLDEYRIDYFNESFLAIPLNFQSVPTVISSVF